MYQVTYFVNIWEDDEMGRWILEQEGMHPPLRLAECDQQVKQYISPVMLTVNNGLQNRWLGSYDKA